jgi:hypothetical protein
VSAWRTDVDHTDVDRAAGGESGRGGRDERRAARLLRCYPASWRARYGEEFTELLLDDLAERPRHWRRTANVAGSGLLARLTSIGLTRHPLEPATQIRVSLATLGCAMTAFGAVGLAMLAQLAIGWQWAAPHGAATMPATVVMAVAAGGLALLVLAGLLPALWCGVAALPRGNRALAGPVSLTLAGVAVLVTGARHFQNSWPGTGGTSAHHALVPAGLAAFSWASTLSVSSYWAHPAALHAFPWTEVAWMAVSPLSLAALAAGLAGIVRRQPLPPRLLAWQARLAAVAAAGMGLFLAGAACWVFSQAPGPAGLFHAGAVDVTGLVVLGAALALAARTAGNARRAAVLLAVSG